MAYYAYGAREIPIGSLGLIPPYDEISHFRAPYKNAVFGQEPPAPAPAASQPVDDLASTMVLHGAVGVLAGAAVAPRGSESIWGAAGFVVGATLGQIGLVGLLAMALYMKAGAAR